MRWEKLGLVYCPNGEQEWAQSHAFIPTSLMLDEDRIRVFAAFLDGELIGRVGYVDVAASDPLRILQVSEKPVLDIGAPGTFDDNGVNPLCIVGQGKELYMYYVGWQLQKRVRYTLLTGLAVSSDGGDTFKRVQRVPVLERSDAELFVRSAADVLLDDGTWKMWYVAGDSWIEIKGKPVPTYNLRYLESVDGVNWDGQGQVCLELAAGGDEFGFGRPFVVKKRQNYEMWYSIRTISKKYRIGFADSPDGKSWRRRDDEAGIDVSPGGWDSEMICCSCVQQTKYGTYMFYNGNNYGGTGFGVAVLKE